MNKYIIILVSLFLLSGCKTSSVLSEVNPLYEEYLKSGEEPPEDVAIWIPKKKMDAKGIGKIEADFIKDTLKRDSGLELKMPKIDIELDKLKD